MLRGLDFTYAYVDDFLVFSKDQKTHEEHLHQLFKRLREYGMVINSSKCIFGVQEINFLGYRITAAGTTPLTSKVEAIQSFQRLKLLENCDDFWACLTFTVDLSQMHLPIKHP